MPFDFKSFFRGLACLLLLSPLPALAQEDAGAFSLELNAAADTAGGSCRLTYVARNRTDTALDRTAFEVVIFDAQGTVTRLLVLEFGELIAGKTKILQFDLSGTECASISEIVINSVAACTEEGAEDDTVSDVCALEGLQASSRTEIAFGI